MLVLAGPRNHPLLFTRSSSLYRYRLGNGRSFPATCFTLTADALVIDRPSFEGRGGLHSLTL